MSLAASMQWDLLPPLTLQTRRVVAAGMVEPASEVGGDGLNGVERQAFLEEMGRGSAGFAMSIFLAGLPFKELAASNNPDLIDEFVKPFVEDRDARNIGCWAITEPPSWVRHPIRVPPARFRGPGNCRRCEG